MKTKTKLHFKHYTNQLGNILHKLRVIKPFVDGSGYSYVFNLYNPLSHLMILLLLSASIFVSMLSSSSVQECIETISELVFFDDYWKEHKNEIVWVSSLPDS